MINDSFLYCITDKMTNKLYIGVHKGRETDGYFCSSKIVLQEHNKRPDDFSRQIIAHGSYKEVLKLEAKILTAIDAKNDNMMYNMHNGDGNFIYVHRTEKYRENMRKKFQNRFVSEETKKRISNSKKGTKVSEETRLKMSLKRKNKPLSKEICNKIKTFRTGTKIYTNLETKKVKFFKENQQPNGWVLGRIV